MLRGFQFSGVPHIHFGPGKITSLPECIYRYGKKVLLISGGGSFLNTKKGKEIIGLLKTADVSVSMISVGSEPSPRDIDHITGEYRDDGHDVVIGIGGGSVIDAGKAVSAMLPHEGSVRDYMEGIGHSKHNGIKVPYVAIPTTSGTGSEATKNAVLSEPGKNGFKKSLRHEQLIPNETIVDPELTLTCPPGITASSGMDALKQIIESYVSYKASLLTDSLAYEGFSCIHRGLLPAFTNGWDLEARTNMAYAALISGITLANAGLGVVHGFASSIGGMFQIPHGVVCAALMANATEITIEKLLLSNPDHGALDKYAAIGRVLSGKPDLKKETSLTLLIDLLHDYTRQLQIDTLGKYGVKQEQLKDIVDKTGNKMNPIVLEKEDLTRILEKSI